MVESWVGAMGRLLPRAILEAGHSFTFVTRDLQHYLRSFDGPGSHPLLGAANILTAETNDDLTEQVSAWHEVFGFDGVITSCDYYLRPVAELAHHLGLPGAAPEAVDRALRKDRTRAAMAAAGLPAPGFAVCDDWEQTANAAARLGYPLILKPVDLCAGMFVQRVDDERALAHAYAQLQNFPVNARHQVRAPQVLLEEMLIGPEVSVETVTVDGVTHVVGVTDKRLGAEPYFVETGHMFPADLDTGLAAAAEQMAVATLAALGFDRGVAHTELRLTAKGPRVIEVNPRPGGNRITELIRRVTGIDLVRVAVQLAAGAPVDLAPAPTGVGSAAVAFLLPPRAGVVTGYAGRPTTDVVESEFKPNGFRAGEPTSNNTYLGHVMVASNGTDAGDRARALIDGITVQYAS